ncbi:MAG: HAD hydrolase-like protein [Anaerolineae bacterium]|nr:HAD hydrolase-like protein [Anaerolineae bacterium]
MRRNWFLDFDDTLASGPTTWGLRNALPKLIHDHALPFDEKSYHAAVLVAQARVARNEGLQPILDDLFESQGWPRTLQRTLLADIQNNYRATLFADTLPFLQRLANEEQLVFILSNNPTAPALAQQLGIGHYIKRYYTPQNSPGTKPKPHPSLWEYVLQTQPGVNIRNSVILGDDPWSDGILADQVGLPFWIIDRDNRYGDVRFARSAWRVKSLMDIPIHG